jgi:pimeloyl-ACP methyl ester carboxylesterase
VDWTGKNSLQTKLLAYKRVGFRSSRFLSSSEYLDLFALLLFPYSHKSIMTDKPLFILVPGAWHGPETWGKVSSQLKELGYNSVSVTLPTTSKGINASFEDDVKATQNVLQAGISQGHNIVIVVHSYGGVVGQSAIKGFTRLRNSAAPARGNSYVIGLVVIASGYAQPDMAFLDGFGGNPPPSWRLDPSGYAEIQVSARELFYDDLPAAEGDEWVAKLRKQSIKAFTEGRDVMYPGWQDVPVWTLITTEDRALPVEAQRMFVGMVKDFTDITVKEIASSHSPMLSKPREVVEFILEATKAFTK